MTLKNKTVECVVRKFVDDRLMLVILFKQGLNFWIHEDGTCSYVPKKSEVEHIKDCLDAVDTYNTFKKNLPR